MSSDRNQPLPATLAVRTARQAYLDENGFTVAAYDAPRTEAMFLRVKFSVPNTPRHQWAIRRHDLHHVATGFGTDLRGEAEISAWELRGGLRSLGLYTGSIVLLGCLMGLLIAPRRTIRAWRSSAGRSLFGDSRARDYDSLLELTVGELRELLGVREEGLFVGRRGIYPGAAH